MAQGEFFKGGLGGEVRNGFGLGWALKKKGVGKASFGGKKGLKGLKRGFGGFFRRVWQDCL